MAEDIPGIDGDQVVWLDENHAYVKYFYQGRWAGLLEMHKRPDGSWCRGSVDFKNRTPDSDHGTWIVVSEEPLTLSPSIRCRTCDEHGWIEGGRWRAA